MQKKLFYYLFYRKRYVKFFRIMKLCFLFVFWGMLSATAKTIAQEQVISLNLKNVTYLELFNELHRQTGVRFLYSSDQLENLSRIDVVADRKKVKEILEDALKETSLTCVFEEDMVMLRERQQQQISKLSVKGLVTDTKKQPLPGVTVMIKGTALGAVTGANGQFLFAFPALDNVTLVFSFVGMKTKEIPYKGEKELNVVLEDEVTQMDEVVVTGIFNKAKESYTGAVKQITSKELKAVGNRNILSSIRNLDPSFFIADNIDIGSDPNKLPDITMRGSGSMTVDVKDLQTDSKTLSSANQPLFIMDGFEITLERMMDLDDNQIETITLLKDASATAMYGTRGANGVVVITTKRPEPGRLQLTYRGGVNIEAPDFTSYNLLDAREKLEYEKLAGVYSGGAVDFNQKMKDLYNKRMLDVARGVNTYWLKYPVRTGVGHRHSLRLEGGDASFRYAAGLSYNHVAGTMKGSDRITVNGNVFLSYNYKNLTFQNDLQVSNNKAKNSPYGTFSDFSQINSYLKPYDDEGNILKYADNETYATTKTINPLYNALLPYKNETKYTSITDNFSIEWRILPELTARGTFSFTSQNNRGDIYKCAKHTDFDSYTGDDYARKGSYEYTTGESFNYETNITLNYSKTFADKHQVFVGLGYNMAQNKNESYTVVAEGISNINMDFLGMASKYKKDGYPSGTEGISRRMGAIANANYTYDNRYFIDVSGKVEGGSAFGSDNRYAPFWSVGLGWNIHREHFWTNNDVITTARLRLSYGSSGSLSYSPYQAMTTYVDYGGKSYQGWYGVKLMGLGNEELGWQKTNQFNVGLDMELFKGYVRFNVDVYNKLTNDLLTDINLPDASGFQSYKANVGKVENKGIEMTANVYLIRNTEKSVFWSVGGSLAHNKNKIKSISNSLDFLNDKLLEQSGANPSFLFKEGQSMNTIFAVKSLGIDPSNGKEIFLDRNGDITYEWDAKDKVACGVDEPKVWGNLNTMFRWKNLSLNAVFGYRCGGQIYNSTLVSKVENTNPLNNADRRVLYDRWKNPGDHAFFKGIADRTATKATSRFVMKENTLECRSISLSYDVEWDWLKKNVGVSYLNITGYAEDVFHISTIKQERGLSYPFARKYSFAFSFRF